MLRRIYAFALILFALLFATTEAGATAQRTFVASYGVDSNPCTITLPCRGFSAAIAQTVTGGEVIVLNSAGYGIVTITKSISIVAPTGVYAGISVSGGQTGVTIDAPGATIVLRGLTINGVDAFSVAGIRLVNGARLRVEGCVVSSLGEIGIRQDAAGSELVVLDTIVRDNAARGVSIVADASAVLDNVRVEHNGGDGIYVAAVSSHAAATIRRSVLSHNAAAGVAAVVPNKPALTNLVIEDSIVASNAGDGMFAGGILDGLVEASARRNAIASNAGSGISVFATSTSALMEVEAVENTFSTNSTSQLKADGVGAVVFAGRNHFGGFGGITLDTLNFGTIYTFGDNTGNSSGSTPGNIPPF